MSLSRVSPLLPSSGVRLLWRVGDYVSPSTGAHAASPKCYVDTPGPGDMYPTL